MQAHEASQDGDQPEVHNSMLVAWLEEEVHEEDEQAEAEEVQVVLARQGQLLGAEVSIQLAECDKAAGQGHATDEVAEDGGGVLHRGSGDRSVDEGADGGAHGCQANQGVEGSDGLGKGDGGHLHTQGGACCRADGEQNGADDQVFLRKINHRGHHGAEDSHNSELAAHVGRGHRGEPTDGGHAEKCGDGGDGLQQLWAGQGNQEEDNSREEHHS
mmetsp:Transcript_37985/g.53017  ORF Transcript_37985/g.53017 Transcript_37985/m.53017 type:complete len:215 (+) Transcript_37985:1019-1663(+)